jgi:hypothetical protein
MAHVPDTLFYSVVLVVLPHICGKILPAIWERNAPDKQYTSGRDEMLQQQEDAKESQRMDQELDRSLGSKILTGQ